MTLKSEFLNKVIENKKTEIIYIGLILPCIIPLIFYLTTKSILIYVISIFLSWIFENIIKAYGEIKFNWDPYDIFPTMSSFLFYFINSIVILFLILSKYIFKPIGA